MVTASVTQTGRYVAVQHESHCREILEECMNIVAMQQFLGANN